MTSAPSPDFEIPSEVAEVFEKFVAAEYAYFTPRGAPLCWPVTPYWYPERGVLAVATGLAYPNKADYAKRNPKVSFLFSDPTSSGLHDPPEILVEGNATVLEDDIQANTDRYVGELRSKFPVARFGLNPVSVRLLDFYLPRLWVEITPIRITISTTSARKVIGRPPASYSARFASDSESKRDEIAPRRPALSPRELAALRRTVEEFESAVLTVPGTDGYPVAKRIEPRFEDETLTLPFDDLENVPCRASVTFHRHRFGGTRFEAYMVRGNISRRDSETVFRPTRLVGFFGNGLIFPLSVVRSVPRLRRRLKKELQRRGKQMPVLRVP